MIFFHQAWNKQKIIWRQCEMWEQMMTMTFIGEELEFC